MIKHPHSNKKIHGAHYVARTSVLQALSRCASSIEQHEFEVIDILYNRIMSLFDKDQYALYEQVANILSVMNNSSITEQLKEAIDVVAVHTAQHMLTCPYNSDFFEIKRPESV